MAVISAMAWARLGQALVVGGQQARRLQRGRAFGIDTADVGVVLWGQVNGNHQRLAERRQAVDQAPDQLARVAGEGEGGGVVAVDADVVARGGNGRGRYHRGGAPVQPRAEWGGGMASDGGDRDRGHGG